MAHGNWPKPLLTIRTRFWAHQVMAIAGYKSKDEFLAACLGTGELAALNNLRMAEYIDGYPTPIDGTLNAVEEVARGSLALFKIGPEKIELWKILYGKTDEALSLLNEVLLDSYGDKSKRWDLEQKALGLVKLLLPTDISDFVQQLKDSNQQDKLWIFDSMSIDDLIVDQTINVTGSGKDGKLNFIELLETYDDVKQFYFLRSLMKEFGSDLICFGYQFQNSSTEIPYNFSISTITASIGLLFLGIEANNKAVKQVAYHVVQGMCRGPIDSEFNGCGEGINADINEYVRDEILHAVKKEVDI